MKTLAAALLVGLSGNKITEDAIKTIFKSVGIKSNEDKIKNVVNALKDKRLEDIISKGLKNLSSLSSTGIVDTEEESLEDINDMEMKENNNVEVEIDTNVNEIYEKTKIIQKFKNKEKFPLELKIYLYKSKKIVFSSFEGKIDDSITVKSKVIKKENAEKKYTDSISSGNAAIFVCEDPLDENRIIINMGNIPSKSEITFNMEFLRFTDFSNRFEIELLRNIPIFTGRDNYIFQNSNINGKVIFSCKNEILNINPKMDKDQGTNYVKILEEKYLNKEKKEYSILYKIENLESIKRLGYIPSSKIYFDIKLKDENLLAFKQESSLYKNEINYALRFKNHINVKMEENSSSFPALFIFLVDQSYSMRGESIKIASKALKLFLQSLPVGSFYQIIGFGTEYKKYDETPKEYTIDNINESLKIIDNLNADLGGTNIYSPLKGIYDSYEIYDKLKISKNIFLLTDGDIEDKEDTLALIENNNSIFQIYSIGIGNNFDKDLIENAGIVGKGNYDFCPNLGYLNKIIVSDINRIVNQTYISQVTIISSLDKNNILNKTEINCLKEKEIMKLNYICDKKEINSDKIIVNISYYIGEKKYEKSYEIIPQEFPKGEELSKLIIYNNILKNSSKDEENLKNALKYQILYEETSLFANLELSNQIQEELKLKIIGNKENNIVKKFQKKESYHYMEEEDDDEWLGFGDIDGGVGGGKKYSHGKNKIKNKEKKEIYHYMEEEDDECLGFGDIFGGVGGGKEYNYEKKISKNKEKKEIEPDLNNKDYVMEIINTQDFIEGYWEENSKTKYIKEKYINIFQLLKDKNFKDNTIITILVILFINKEHSELLFELLMIIKKAEVFIKKSTYISYEDIIKEININ